MENLWLAILFYSLGLAAVLHLRPAFMFNENGTWKEFGYKRDSRHTMLPFWLFAIVWAVLSYAIATAIAWSYSAAPVAVATSSAAYYNSNIGSWSSGPSSSEYEEEEEEEVDMRPVSEPPKRGRGRPRKTETAQPRTGYYVLEPANEGGLRRYVYYGSTPPPPVEEE
jgi:hypothetical protein